MNRHTYTGDPRTLREIAAANAAIDHFHCIEVVDGKDYVFHFSVEGNAIINEKRRAENPRASDFDRCVGDEWHELR